MRATLRRSCDACAKAKHGCDLRTPSCSRCVKRKVRCVYANQPLTTSSRTELEFSENKQLDPSLVDGRDTGSSSNQTQGDHQMTPNFPDSSVTLLNPSQTAFDPFDSYPPTRLPRVHIQRLIHHFLSSIAFQYYPLDLNMDSNPFVVSWWPLALADPALFHVSLQTASLDRELRAQKGFHISEILMADSVSLVRRRIEDPLLAYQDETLDSVVTLAAIEHGKGNVQTSIMHIEGVKRMVNVRGGINEILRTSPLTARMVSWVSMLVMETPQFGIQDDMGFGSGLGPIPQWQLASTGLDAQDSPLDGLDVDPAISDVLTRLRIIIHGPWGSHLTNTELHDLTCFVVQKLLLFPPMSPTNSPRSAISECLRYTMVLYMLIIHGTTYYSHFHLASNLIFQLQRSFEILAGTNYLPVSLEIWILSMGMASTLGITDHPWLLDRAGAAKIALGLRTWDDVLVHLESVLWMHTAQGDLVRQHWEEILMAAS